MKIGEIKMAERHMITFPTPNEEIKDEVRDLINDEIIPLRKKERIFKRVG